MANSLNTMPITVDTDLASFGAAQTLQAKPFGLRVWKIALVATTATTAGTVTITDPTSNTPLVAPMLVTAAQTADTILYYDNPTQLLQWRDFKVTGVTATGTRLFIWYRL